MVHASRTGSHGRIGVYTSPHLRTVRERIRLDGKVISEEVFTRRFAEVWDRLPKSPTASLDIPRYLQLLTLVAIHTFIQESVDVAILEAHMGGEYDATNVIPKPMGTVITSIGEDHVHLLGPSLRDIAWHKGGIIKRGCLAYTSPQTCEVLDVLKRRAGDKAVTLQVVAPDPSLLTWEAKLPEVQVQNCSLAIAMVQGYLTETERHISEPLTSDELRSAVVQFSWPGRFQRIIDGSDQWFLDSAHNVQGLSHATKWYITSTSGNERWGHSKGYQDDGIRAD